MMEMDSSRGTANSAILDAVRGAGPVGIHIDDLMVLLGFDARKQVQPRLYELQNRGLVERLPAQKWRSLVVTNPMEVMESGENGVPPQGRLLPRGIIGASGLPPRGFGGPPRGPRGPLPRGPGGLLPRGADGSIPRASGGPLQRAPSGQLMGPRGGLPRIPRVPMPRGIDGPSPRGPRGPFQRGPRPDGLPPRGPPPFMRPPVVTKLPGAAKLTVALPGQIGFISYKNTLQEYCQKLHLAVPQYKSEKSHIGYIGTVSFGQNYIKAEAQVPTTKDAEQRVAFDALKAVEVLPSEVNFDILVGKNSSNIKRKAEGNAVGPPSKQPMIDPDASSTVFKSKLNEFAQKFHLPAPTYDTITVSGGFVTNISFQGRDFKSSQPMSKKKLSEQNAAHVALYYFGQISVLPPGANPQVATPGGNGDGAGLDVKSLVPEASPEVRNESLLNPTYSYKNRLQEHCQRGKMQNPNYDTISTTGGFACKVTMGTNEYNGPILPNKKKAEQAVAFMVLQELGIMQRPAGDVSQNASVGMIPGPPAAMLSKPPSAMIPKPPAAILNKSPAAMLPPNQPPIGMPSKPPVPKLMSSFIPAPPAVMLANAAANPQPSV